MFLLSSQRSAALFEWDWMSRASGSPEVYKIGKQYTTVSPVSVPMCAHVLRTGPRKFNA